MYHFFDPEGTIASIVNSKRLKATPVLKTKNAVKQLFKPIGLPSKLGQICGGLENFLIIWSKVPKYHSRINFSK